MSASAEAHGGAAAAVIADAGQPVALRDRDESAAFTLCQLLTRAHSDPLPSSPLADPGGFMVHMATTAGSVATPQVGRRSEPPKRRQRASPTCRNGRINAQGLREICGRSDCPGKRNKARCTTPPEEFVLRSVHQKQRMRSVP